MKATHICGWATEGPSLAVLDAVEEHKERCLAEHEAHARTVARSLHPSVWPAPVLETT